VRLYWKITLALFLAAVLPLAILLGYAVVGMEQTVHATAERTLRAMGRELGRSVERSVQEGFSSIRIQADNLLLANAADRPEDVRELFRRVLRIYPIIKDISLLESDGDIMASARYAFRGDWAATTWFERAMQGETVLSEVHAVVYPYDVVMTAAAPVHNARGDIIGVLAGQFDLDPLREIVAEADFGPGGMAYLVDARGRVVVSRDPAQSLEPLHFPEVREAIRRGEKATLELDVNGARTVFVVAPLPGRIEAPVTGWSVVMRQPTEQAYSAVLDVREGLVVATAIAMLVMIVLGSCVSRQISRRVEKLASATADFGRGEFSLDLDDLGRDEIGELGRAFTEAGRQLRESQRQVQAYQEDLERLVDVRTMELRKTNARLTQEVAERSQAEARLAEVNKHLESIVADRTQALSRKAKELEQANDELRELDAMKSSFVALVSHELRTPLTSIVGFAKLVEKSFDKHFAHLEETDARLNSKARIIRENLRIIGIEGDRLSRLIADLLDLSRIESGKAYWRDTEVDLAESVRAALDSLHAEIQKKRRVDVVVDMEENLPELNMDPDRLLQVLVNLVGNALKFTDRGEVRILGSRNGKGLRLSVADTGPGIPQGDLERIFGKFQQVRESGAPTHGAGLGLAVCREIVEHYGGRIWAESDPGGGARFVVELPTENLSA
jgi:signal transduction histidine kinase